MVAPYFLLSFSRAPHSMADKARKFAASLLTVLATLLLHIVNSHYGLKGSPSNEHLVHVFLNDVHWTSQNVVLRPGRSLQRSC